MGTHRGALRGPPARPHGLPGDGVDSGPQVTCPHREEAEGGQASRRCHGSGGLAGRQPYAVSLGAASPVSI